MLVKSLSLRLSNGTKTCQEAEDVERPLAEYRKGCNCVTYFVNLNYSSYISL